MVREDGIRMALSRHPVIRFPSSEESRYIKRFGDGVLLRDGVFAPPRSNRGLVDD